MNAQEVVIVATVFNLLISSGGLAGIIRVAFMLGGMKRDQEQMKETQGDHEKRLREVERVHA